MLRSLSLFSLAVLLSTACVKQPLPVPTAAAPTTADAAASRDDNMALGNPSGAVTDATQLR